MTKTMKGIQIFVKIAMILSKVVFVCCIVGAVLCVVGIAVTSVLGLTGSFKLGGLVIHGLIEAEDALDMGTLYAGTIGGLICCIVEGILAMSCTQLFKRELEVGTPFDLEIAKKTLKTAIIFMAAGLVGAILMSITDGVIGKMFEDAARLDADLGGNITMGVSLLIMSFLFRAGAEEKQAAAQQITQ